LWTRKITDSKKKNIEKIPTVTTSDEWQAHRLKKNSRKNGKKSMKIEKQEKEKSYTTKKKLRETIYKKIIMKKKKDKRRRKKDS